MKSNAIKEQCESIKTVIDDAITASSNKKNMSVEEQEFSDRLVEQLEDLNKSFKDEIEGLSKNTEWEKFCIAFLGETNAGKSTLIESMRILYNEETRLEALLAKKKDVLENIKKNNEIYNDIIEKLKKISNEVTQHKYFFEKKWIFITGVISFVCGALLMFVFSLFIKG